MTKITGTIVVARKPEDVFAYLDDFNQHPAWQSDVKSTKVLTDGPTRVGTEVEELRQMGRRAMTTRWRVTSHEPPHRSTFETYESSMMKPSGVITVTPEGEGSRVTFEMDPNPMGFTKLLMPVIAGQIRKSISRNLETLKGNLERV